MAGSVGVHLHAGGHGGNILVVALGHFIGAEFAQRARHAHGADKLALGQRGVLVGQVKIFQRQLAAHVAALQAQRGAQGNQRRHAVANRRAIGDIAAQRAGVLDRGGGKAARQLGPVRRPLAERGKGVVQRRGGADFQLAVYFGNLFQLGHRAQLNQAVQRAALLGHPQPHVGAAGHQPRGGVLLAQRGQLGQAARAEALAAVSGAIVQRRQRRQLAQGGCHRRAVPLPARGLPGGLGGVENWPVAGAAAQIARQTVFQLGAAGAVGLAVVAGKQRHGKAWRAKAALRAVVVDQRLLQRVQAVGVGQVFHGEQRLAVQRWQKLNTGVYRAQAQPAVGVQLAQHHGAGAAIALGAAFLAAGLAQVFTQVLQHGAGGRGAGDLAQAAAKIKLNRSFDHDAYTQAVMRSK